MTIVARRSDHKAPRLKLGLVTAIVGLTLSAPSSVADSLGGPSIRSPLQPGGMSLRELKLQLDKDLAAMHPEAGGVHVGPALMPNPGVQRPQMQFTPLGQKSFAVENKGTSPLTLKFWDAAGSWQDVTTPSLTKTVISCPACEKDVKIAFHDGKVQRYYTVPLQGTIALDWSKASGTWALTGAATETAASN